MTTQALEQRLERLARAGVRIIDPRQTFVADDVRLDRIFEGVIVHPGTRLHGARTWIGPGAEVGTEGPATVIASVFDGR